MTAASRQNCFWGISSRILTVHVKLVDPESRNSSFKYHMLKDRPLQIFTNFRQVLNTPVRCLLARHVHNKYVSSFPQGFTTRTTWICCYPALYSRHTKSSSMNPSHSCPDSCQSTLDKAMIIPSPQVQRAEPQREQHKLTNHNCRRSNTKNWNYVHA
jgi:hypothetical protein